MPSPSNPTSSLSDIQHASSGIKVLLPNSNTIQSTHKATLNIPTLPNQAKTFHLFRSLSSGSLLSVEQLCDAGCTATFSNTSAEISHQGKPLLRGKRHPSTALWHLDPATPGQRTPNPSMHTAVGLPGAAARMKFYHAALFSPSLSTLHQAIRSGFLSSFPGLFIRSLQLHPPISEATVKGHLNAHRQHHRSTQRSFSTPGYIFNATAVPPSRTHHTYATCFEATARSSQIKPAPSFSHPLVATNMFSFYTTSSVTTFQLPPFLLVPKSTSSRPTAPLFPFFNAAASAPAFNVLTMKSPTLCVQKSTLMTLPINSHLQVIMAAMLQSGPSRCSRTTL